MFPNTKPIIFVGLICALILGQLSGLGALIKTASAGTSAVSYHLHAGSSMGNPLIVPPSSWVSGKTASDLADFIPNCISVSVWNGSPESWTTYQTGFSANDFALEPGIGYSVSVHTDTLVYFDATQNESDVIYMPRTDKDIDQYHFTVPSSWVGRTAEELISSINNANDIYYYNVSGAGTIGHVQGLPFNNFTLEANISYIVQITADTYFVPNLTENPQSGDIIKLADTDTLYYLADNSRRYVLPTPLGGTEDYSEDVKNSWSVDTNQAKVVSQSTLESYALGGNIVLRPGTHLIRVDEEGWPDVYSIGPRGALHALSQDQLLYLYSVTYGDWDDQLISTVSPVYFVNYVLGDDLGNKYPSGTLIKYLNSSQVYLIHDGYKFPITSNGLLANNFSSDYIINAPSDVVYPTGQTINSAYECLTDIAQLSTCEFEHEDAYYLEYIREDGTVNENDYHAYCDDPTDCVSSSEVCYNSGEEPWANNRYVCYSDDGGNGKWYKCQYEEHIGKTVSGYGCVGVGSSVNWRPIGSSYIKTEDKYSCTDGYDNDADGKIDSADSDCAISTCSETDNGKDYYTKGTTNSFIDYCMDDTEGMLLREFWCQNGAVKTTTYQCPYGCSNGACIAQAPAEKYLTVSAALDNPASSIYAGNSDDLVIGKFVLKSSYEDVEILSLDFVSQNYNGGNLADIFDKIHLYDGEDPITSFTPTSTDNALINLPAGSLIIPAGTSGKTITLKADTHCVSPLGICPANTADGLKLDLSSDRISARGLSTFYIYTNSEKSGSYSTNRIYLFKSYPVIVTSNTNSSITSNGIYDLYETTIYIETKGSIGWHKITFDIDTTGEPGLTNLELYEGDILISTTNFGSDGRYAFYVNQFAADYREIPAGSSKIYTLKGTITNYSSSRTIEVDVSLVGDIGEEVVEPDNAHDINIDYTSNFIWSDLNYGNSSTTATSTAEWVNGRLVKNLGLASQGTNNVVDDNNPNNQYDDQTVDQSPDTLNFNYDLAQRLRGRILLAVQRRGRVYIVDQNGLKHEVTFGNLMSLFRKLALGVSNKNIYKIPIHPNSVSKDIDRDGDGFSDWTEVVNNYNPDVALDTNPQGAQKLTFDLNLANRLKGHLVILPESHGRINYIDQEGYRWEVTFANIMNLFSNLALGINNQNLDQIPEAE